MAKVRPTSQTHAAPVPDDRWRIPDTLWQRIEALLPPRPPHPLGCHNPRVPDRRAMDGIFFVLRTGCQWNALNATGICSSSSAHRRFQEWTAAGVFVNLWATGLQEYDAVKGLDWSWLAMDGAMTKAPLGGEWTGKNPTDRGKLGAKRSLLMEANGIPVGLAVEGANRHDKKLVEATLESIPVGRPEPTERAPPRDVPGQGIRLRRHEGVGRGVRLHRPCPGPWRGGEGDQAGGGREGPTLGRGADTQLDESVPSHPDPMGEEGGELLRHAPLRLRLDHLPSGGPTGIGSKSRWRTSGPDVIRLVLC